MELAKIIDELGLRMRLLRAGQEADMKSEDLADRDVLILELLAERGKLTVSEISGLCAHVSESTISTNITKLWRKKLVTKSINPQNQRVTFVELTAKGSETVEQFKAMRAQRLAALFTAMEFSQEERQVMERVFARAVEFFDKVSKETK